MFICLVFGDSSPNRNSNMSLESVEEVETAPSGSLEEVNPVPTADVVAKSPSPATTPQSAEAAQAEGAPPLRRKSLSRLRRRLSRTFRLSFSGSLSDFAQTFTIDERGEPELTHSASTSAMRSLDTEDVLPNKFNGKNTTWICHKICI